MDALRDSPEVLYGAALALLIVVLLTPAVGGMARLLGVVDRPEARRLNPNPIPRLGGIAIFFGIFVPALAFLELGRETRGILLGAAVATVVGAIDDFRVLKPGRKLAGQVVAAAIPPFFDVWIDHFTFPFLGPVDLPAAVGIPVTMVWIVAVMNMVNFLDGMDGLAAGVCGIAGATFAILSLSLGKVDPAILSAIVAGACVGFLPVLQRSGLRVSCRRRSRWRVGSTFFWSSRESKHSFEIAPSCRSFWRCFTPRPTWTHLCSTEGPPRALDTS